MIEDLHKNGIAIPGQLDEKVLHKYNDLKEDERRIYAIDDKIILEKNILRPIFYMDSGLDHPNFRHTSSNNQKPKSNTHQASSAPGPEPEIITEAATNPQTDPPTESTTNRRMSEETLSKMYTSLDKVDPSEEETRSSSSQQTSFRSGWSRDSHLLLALAGFSSSLLSLMRLPHLCYQHGGTAFLVAYLASIVLLGTPLALLEMCVGQFMSRCGVAAWAICPIFQGVGWSTSVVSLFVLVYRSLPMVWGVSYLLDSFTVGGPRWQDNCGYGWNEGCQGTMDESTIVGYQQNYTNDSVNNEANLTNYTNPLPAASEYWLNQTLRISDSPENFGTLKWDLVIFLVPVWFLTFISSCRGIRMSVKILYVTLPVAYAFLVILLVYSFTLPGAYSGVEVYLVPDFSKLYAAQPWIDAGSQVIFSYGLGLGTWTALGSNNNFYYNCHKDLALFSVIHVVSNMLLGLLVFCFLGHLSTESGVLLDDIATSGLPLVYVSMPAAVSLLPAPQLWSAMFYIMVILFGLNTQMIGVEGVVTALMDASPRFMKARTVLTGSTCALLYLTSLSMVTYGGIYIFEMFDFYPGSHVTTLLALLECCNIAYIYGVTRFHDNVEMMMDLSGMWIKASWCIITPSILALLFITSLLGFDYTAIVQEPLLDTEPLWMTALGWGLAMLVFIPISITTVYNTVRCLDERAMSGSGSPDCELVRPRGLKRHQLRESDLSQRDLHMEMRTMSPAALSLQFPMMVEDQHEGNNNDATTRGGNNNVNLVSFEGRRSDGAADIPELRVNGDRMVMWE